MCRAQCLSSTRTARPLSCGQDGLCSGDGAPRDDEQQRTRTRTKANSRIHRQLVFCFEFEGGSPPPAESATSPNSTPTWQSPSSPTRVHVVVTKCVCSLHQGNDARLLLVIEQLTTTTNTTDDINHGPLRVARPAGGRRCPGPAVSVCSPLRSLHPPCSAANNAAASTRTRTTVVPSSRLPARTLPSLRATPVSRRDTTSRRVMRARCGSCEWSCYRVQV